MIISLQYERLICANGPTGGHLIRPSDGKEAKKIAFIQCVGSRDLKRNRYCSSVCCMHSTKEAILAREHYKNAEPYIFYMDLRAVGKGFQEYLTRGEKDYNVTYIKGRVAEINEDNEKNPIVRYENIETGKIEKKTVDMVVLATALFPSKGTKEVAERLGVELDEYNFFETNPYLPTETTRKGVFACGYAQGPADVPESVAQGSAAAQKAAEVLPLKKRL